ncbi:MAG: hypothetical protein HOV97_04920 [Nonomuraea sp.]|nr:hypothetical protein [Nonomuraea sp.]
MDVLTDVRFWMQVMRDAKRTIICPPEMAEAVLERVCEFDMQDHFDVQGSPACPPKSILVIDSQALEAAGNEAFQHARPRFF